VLESDVRNVVGRIRHLDTHNPKFETNAGFESLWVGSLARRNGWSVGRHSSSYHHQEVRFG